MSKELKDKIAMMLINWMFEKDKSPYEISNKILAEVRAVVPERKTKSSSGAKYG